MADQPYSARVTTSTEPLRSSLDVDPLAGNKAVFFSAVLQGQLIELDQEGSRQLLEKLDGFGVDVSEGCHKVRQDLRAALKACTPATPSI